MIARARPGRWAVAAVLVLFVAACTSATSGRGSTGPTASGPTASGRTSAGASSAPSSTTGSPSASSGALVTRFPRRHVSTAIGDPGTADVCAATPLSRLRGLGFAPRYADLQLPPSCFIRMLRGGTVAYSLEVYAASAMSGRVVRTRSESGLTVSVFAYDRSIGNCRRVVHAQGVYLDVDAASPAGHRPVAARTTCAGTDRLTAVAAAAAAATARPYPRLSLAHPSVTSVDFCDVAEATDFSAWLYYLDPSIGGVSFGNGCTIDTHSQSSIVEFEISRTGLSKDLVPQRIDGHTIYVDSGNTDAHCSFASAQGVTDRGYREQVNLEVDNIGPKHPGLCAQAGHVLATMIGLAGLR